MPTIHHVWSHNPRSCPDALRRQEVAQSSWHREQLWARNWRLWPAEDKELSRRLDADRGLPYVRDLIGHAMDRGGGFDSDIISFSNSDVGCIHGITGYVLDHVRKDGCAFAHRYDAGRLEKPIGCEADVRNLQWYPGSDWFWFSREWWERHGPDMPDMVIGREYWDAVLRQIMKRSGGSAIPFSIWHEKHASEWERPGLRDTLPGNQHNRAMAVQWFARNGSDANDPYRSTWNVVPGVTVQSDPNAYTATDRLRRHSPSRLVLPIRLEFHQNPLRRPPIPS